MFKKLITFCIGLMCFASMQAQTESTINSTDIQYWVGQGDNAAILVVDFGTSAYAWGYRFSNDDEPTVLNMVTAVDAADPRLAYAISNWETYEYGFYYVEWPTKFMATEYRFKVNGEMADELDAFSDYDLENGTIVKISVEESDVWSTTITPATVAEMPQFSTINRDDIVYWVGEGEKQATVIVYWADPATALAWGYRFDGEPTVTDLFTALAEADPRLTAGGNSIEFVDGDVNLSFQDVENNYLQFDVEGTVWPGWNTQLFDGAVIRVGESLFGTGYDSTYSYGSWFPAGVIWTTEIQPVSDPNAELPEEAVIDANNIVYWVGEGTNQVVMAINWADTALAWGFRFAAATVSEQDVMDGIAAADPRFSYTMNEGYLGDILFALGAGDTLRITDGNWWESKRNGISDAGMTQILENGDFEKWADPAAGIVVDSMEYNGYWYYMYNYPMTIYPVSVPQSEGGINSADAMDVQLYPNPASTQIVVRFDALQCNTEAALYDMTGRKVYAQILNAGENQMTVPVAQVANGIYLLRVGQCSTKVVVRH